MNRVENYLRVMTEIQRGMGSHVHGYYGYFGLEDFVLRHGRVFEPAPLPRGVRRGRMTLCYMNAALLAIEDRRFTYCEGFAAGIIPVMHAWVCDDQGRALDVTWKDGKQYVGVPVNRKYLMRSLARKKTYGLIDNWQQGWPMLKDGPEKWAQQSVMQHNLLPPQNVLPVTQVIPRDCNEPAVATGLLP